MKNPTYELPAHIFYRTQPSIDEEGNSIEIKLRQVWGLPQRVIALEYYMFCNIIQRVHNSNKYGGNTIYSSGLTNYEISQCIINKLRNKSGLGEIYSMDYSKYDRTIPDFAIDLFFSICKEELILTDKEEKILNILRFYLKHTPFCYDGKFFIQNKGMPSGSYLTNLLDTWWNLTLWTASYNIMNSVSNTEQYIEEEDVLDGYDLDDILDNGVRIFEELGICGDDCIVSTVNMHVEIHIRLCSEVGMNIETNQVISNPLEPMYFLGRYWDELSRPIQTELYFIGHLVVRTKRYRKDEVDFDISEMLWYNRVMSILLPFHNGIDFLYDNFLGIEEIEQYLRGRMGFYLLKDWPIKETYEYVNRVDSMSWTRF